MGLLQGRLGWNSTFWTFWGCAAQNTQRQMFARLSELEIARDGKNRGQNIQNQTANLDTCASSFQPSSMRWLIPWITCHMHDAFVF